MEIERINEYTVKFYISYVDIEERGFDREEIWYNRERSEELFWEMMDEVHQEEEFTVEGPLWIQVQALEKGLEVLVTRAQISKDGHKFELPISDEKFRDMPVDERIESLLDEHFNTKRNSDSDLPSNDEDQLDFLLRFQDFEDAISLAHRTQLLELTNKLYYFEGHYYLYIEFLDADCTEDELENTLSVVLEYGQESRISIHRIEEYGKTVMKESALSEIAKHFPLK
ncbi:adaptor protein MecA [Bacillus luteolus]|uniref:Adapter protein MecA n=1 Tax=Litchfieldia luteola TaxID=682179 RepID=A0ABR9QLK8_9BACI|nr:adaptor protein MecA [Cytobacillus luteolus]MBE4909386.1 adaptor protein MecA [Cytobacillus luteolus]MBP1940784.1 adapter protein MecA 1/2 [Cytobacillus luteolus]